LENFSKEELSEALRAVTSMISKCENAQQKDSLGQSQRTLLSNRIKALQISSALITNALERKE
jgi:hypothetical protein